MKENVWYASFKRMGDRLIRVRELNYPNCHVNLCWCVQMHKHNIHNTKSLADIACCYRTHLVPPIMPNAPCSMWWLTGLERPLTQTHSHYTHVLITYILVNVCRYTCTHTHKHLGTGRHNLWSNEARGSDTTAARNTGKPITHQQPHPAKAHPSRPPPPRDNTDCTSTVATQRPPYIHGSHISLRPIGLNCPHPTVSWNRQLGTRETEPPLSSWEGRYGANIWQDSLELGTQLISFLWAFSCQGRV